MRHCWSVLVWHHQGQSGLRVAVVVADINDPHGNFFAFGVKVRLRTIQENAAPLVADGFGGGVAGGLFFLPAMGAHVFTLAGAVAVPVGI